MTPDTLQKLKALLIKHEGLRLRLYKDTTGNQTIGVGRNLTAGSLRKSEVLFMFNNDVEFLEQVLPQNIPFFNELNPARQIVLADMCFNLGLKGLLQFKNMLGALQHKDFDTAADHILQSKAANQNKNRYKQLATIMRTGELN